MASGSRNTAHLDISNGRKDKDKNKTLVGRIIFSNFLSMSLARYEKLIRRTEVSALFKLLVQEAITVSSLPSIHAVDKKIGRKKLQILAEFTCGNGNPAIHVRSDYLTRQYYIHTDKLDRLKDNGHLKKYSPDEIQSLHHRLNRITARNRMTVLILNKLAACQREFLCTGDELNLKPLSRASLTRQINEDVYEKKIDASWVSRILHNKYIIIPEDRVIPTDFLFPSNRIINGWIISEIVEHESACLKEGNLNQPFSDREIRKLMQNEYKIEISKREVTTIRNEIGIPACNKRGLNYAYPGHGIILTELKALKEPFVSSAPSLPGIYELSLMYRRQEYPYKSHPAIYIGSTNNICKRLKVHMSGNGSNPIIGDFAKKNAICFRYTICQKDWRKLEKEMYFNFVETYGSPPVCNRIKP